MGETIDQAGASTETMKAFVSEQELKLLGLLRDLNYGEIRIVVKAYEIVQIEEKKSIKL